MDELLVVTRKLSTEKKSWIIGPDPVCSVVGLLDHGGALTTEISTCYNLTVGDINQGSLLSSYIQSQELNIVDIKDIILSRKQLDSRENPALKMHFSYICII